MGIEVLEKEVQQLSKEKADVEQKAEAAYEKYKNGELPEMTPEVKAAAEKAYAKLHGAGVVEQQRASKSVLKKAQNTESEESGRITQAMVKLGDDAPHAARAFQKFKQGAEVKLGAEDQSAAQAAWEKYKASSGTDVDSASSAARTANSRDHKL